MFIQWFRLARDWMKCFYPKLLAGFLVLAKTHNLKYLTLLSKNMIWVHCLPGYI